MVAEPDPEHLAYTGTHLHHHTGNTEFNSFSQLRDDTFLLVDMNYREKSPGMQLLHCLKVGKV